MREAQYNARTGAALYVKLGDILHFSPRMQKREPKFKGEWIAIGFIAGTSRIELDRWPREGTYTAYEAEHLDVVRAATPETIQQAQLLPHQVQKP